MVGGESCQAFVSSQELEGEDGHLEKSALFLPSLSLSPCLSAYQGVWYSSCSLTRMDSNLKYG